MGSVGRLLSANLKASATRNKSGGTAVVAFGSVARCAGCPKFSSEDDPAGGPACPRATLDVLSRTGIVDGDKAPVDAALAGINPVRPFAGGHDNGYAFVFVSPVLGNEATDRETVVCEGPFLLAMSERAWTTSGAFPAPGDPLLVVYSDPYYPFDGLEFRGLVLPADVLQASTGYRRSIDGNVGTLFSGAR
jgi:hypothetical protein